MSNSSGRWLTVREAAEREGVSKTAIQKRIRRFEETRDPARLKGYADVCQDERGNYLLLLPDNQPQTLEVVNDEASLPAIPAPDNAELALRLAQVSDLLLSQQHQIERLTKLVEAQGQQAAERDREREQAAEERAERMERALADGRWAMEAREQEASKRPWWQLWRR